MLYKVVLLRALVLATAIALLLNLPITSFADSDLALLYGLLALGSVYFSVLLAQGEISTVYALGILGTLTLPVGASATVAWGLFGGALIGSILRTSQRQHRPRYHRTAPIAHNAITVTARVTLSYLLAGAVYRALGGQQPLTGLALADMLPFLGFSLVYIAVYLGVFLLAVHIDNRSMRAALAQNRLLIALTMLVPPPFIIGTIVIAQPDHILAPTLVVGELVLITMGLYGFSRMHYRLHRQAREMAALATVSRAVRANQDLATLLGTVYRQLADLLFIDHFEAVVCQPDDRFLTQLLVVDNGLAHTQPVLVERQPRSLIDHVLQTQMPLLIEREVAAQASRLGLNPPVGSFSAWLGVPLLAGGRSLGALVVASAATSQHFGAEEYHVVTIIAAATSTAIDNAQLYKQQAARVAQLGNLNTVLALLTETLSPDDVIDQVISSASAVSEATAVAVYRYVDGSFTLVRSAGLSDDFAASPTLTVAAGLDYAGGQAVVVADATGDDRVHQQVLREGKQAWIELSLVVSGQTIGAIILYYDDPQHVESEHVELLRTFANQAAQAIHNADMYAGTYRALETRIEQLSTLAAMGRKLAATMNISAICEVLLNDALEATGAQAGALLLDDPARGQADLVAARGYPPGVLGGPVTRTGGITGRVLRDGQPAHSADITGDSDYVALLPQTRSQLTMPIIWRDQTLGAITLESENLAHFDAEDRNFVSQLVNQTVLALENARLFNDTREARDRMQAILNTMTEAIILIDRHEIIALANPRVALLGLERETLIGKALEDSLATTDLAGRMGFEAASDVLRLVRSLRTTTLPYQPGLLAYTLATDQAPVHIQREVFPVPGEQGEIIGTLLVFYDETEQHQLERAREELSQMIVHDLRSPLTAVTSSVSLLSEIIPSDSEFSSLVEKTAGSSQRAIRKLLSRVDSLLDISRMKSGQLALQLDNGQVSDLIENVCAELEPLAQALDVQVVAHITPDEPTLIMDTEKIERVLLNLVDNALKFSPRATEIAVHIYRLPGDDSPLLRVDVIDRGPGIPEAERGSIFDRFVQVQQYQPHQRRGSGLGLSFCKLAIEAHGGHIWLEDNPAGGSVFAFTLPIQTGESIEATSA